ncbi:MAG TPA: hypothetical protein VJN96_07760 [Vicinamibacterales bacterium]|nr:hypothetical protein [Vicinamibacterales bacterium]
MALRNPLGNPLAIILAGTVAVASASQTKAVPPVAPAALQKLLPAIDGWTSGVARADLVELSPETKYSFANMTFTRNDQRVKLTLADTGFSSDSLAALAMMVVSMPDDFSGQVGDMSIKRTLIGGAPGVEAWDPQKSAGEVTVVVGGRFVATAETSKIDSIATLRSVLDKVDLKALAALK